MGQVLHDAASDDRVRHRDRHRRPRREYLVAHASGPRRRALVGWTALGFAELLLVLGFQPTPSISIGGAVPHPFVITAAELGAMPRMTVTAATHGDPAATYEGVLLGDLLVRSGVPTGAALRGPAMTTMVLCTAADGYRVAFALAEIDSALSGRVVLLADRKNGQPLAGDEGPFRLIVPSDRRPARWIRQLTTITVTSP